MECGPGEDCRVEDSSKFYKNVHWMHAYTERYTHFHSLIMVKYNSIAHATGHGQGAKVRSRF